MSTVETGAQDKRADFWHIQTETTVQTSGTFNPTADVTSWGEYFEQKTDMSVFHVFL